MKIKKNTPRLEPIDQLRSNSSLKGAENETLSVPIDNLELEDDGLVGTEEVPPKSVTGSSKKGKRILPKIKVEKPVETKRDKALRHAKLTQNKWNKSAKVALPSTVEARNQVMLNKRIDPVISQVKEVLDILLPAIITELGLKLDGTILAQNNAIKRIVDEYLAANPVISDRAESIENNCKEILQQKIAEITELLNINVPKEVANIIEKESLSKFRQEISKMSTTVDDVNQNSSKVTKLSNDHKLQLEEIFSKFNDFKSNMDSKVENIEKDLVTIKEKQSEFQNNFDVARATIDEHGLRMNQTGDEVEALKKKGCVIM